MNIFWENILLKKISVCIFRTLSVKKSDFKGKVFRRVLKIESYEPTGTFWGTFWQTVKLHFFSEFDGKISGLVAENFERVLKPAKYLSRKKDHFRRVFSKVNKIGWNRLEWAYMGNTRKKITPFECMFWLLYFKQVQKKRDPFVEFQMNSPAA